MLFKKITKSYKKYLPVYILFVIMGKYEMIWLPGQAVKTLASHAGIRGSIPLGVIKKALLTGLFLYYGSREGGC